jgi:alpha-glucosidase
MDEFLWWRDGVIYQIYPRSFADSNGDGIGDLPGIISRLDYLASLGIDAIWLSPIYPSPDKDFGYDISNYMEVDPRFGSLADFDHLLEEAHQRGIHLILDLVLNHTSDQHTWFQESRSSRDNPKRDWYIWSDRPNNWQANFGGPAWEYDALSDQYYLHLFTKEQPT